MVLQDGKTTTQSNSAAATANSQQLLASKKGKRKAQEPEQTSVDGNKKRKTEDLSLAEFDKENLNPPSTPPPPEQSKEHEKTPGRVGPVIRISFSPSPDIKPFKGPPGKKVRKTRAEKNEEYKQFIREHENHPFHALYVCYDKGPNGSPTYDSSGFELDYEKVADWMRPRPYNKKAMVRGMERSVENSIRKAKRMAEIFFEKGEAPESHENANYWKDRVSKDLNVPWHKIDVEHFQEWESRGFKKARRGEYENFSTAEKERMMTLMSGASLRK